MGNNKNNKGAKNIEPSTHNDQLGENASNEYKSERYDNAAKNKKTGKR